MAISFAIKVNADASSADKAASSVQRLDAAIRQESTTLRALEAQMKNLSRAGSVDIETGRKLTAGIDAQKNKVAQLTQAMVNSGGAGFVKSTEKASALTGALGGLANKGGAVGKALASLGPYGIAAAAAIGVVTIAALGASAAIGYLGSKLVALGVQASEAKGDVTRSLELLYGSEKAAEHTYKVLESLTGDVAISQGRVMELADTLIKAGQVNGDAMVRSIAAIGKAEAARKGAGQVIEGVITRSQQARMFSISRSELMQVGLSYRDLAKEISKGTGMAVGDAELRLRTGGVQLKAGLNALTSVIDSKMGDIANKKLMTVSVQSQRVREAFSRLFEGVNAAPFARVLNIIANQLSESSVSGAALRSMLKGAFEEVSRAVEYAIPYVDKFFRGAILLALKLYNELYPVRKAIKETFGGGTTEGLEATTRAILDLSTMIAATFGYAARAIAYIIEQTPKITRALAAGTGTSALGGGVADQVNAMANKEKAKQKGVNVAQGVAEGIAAGSPQVEAAMKAMGDRAIGAFDAKLQIQSPSKVMTLRGRFVDQGLAKGVNDNAEEPAKAAAGVGKGVEIAMTPKPGQPQPAQRGTGGAPPGAGAGISLTLNIHERAIVVSGSNGQEIAASLKDPLTELFADTLEKAAAMLGALEVKGAA